METAKCKTVEEEMGWRVDCSDEESGEPDIQELVRLYEMLDKDGVIELEWQCPGRQAPSPMEGDHFSDDDDKIEIPDIKDFDFADELSQLQFTPRRNPCTTELKGSAKKKTTSFDSILSNMRRHRQMEELERSVEDNS